MLENLWNSEKEKMYKSIEEILLKIMLILVLKFMQESVDKA